MARYRVVPRRVIPADYITDLKQRIENLRRAVLQKNEEIERLRDAIRALAKDRADILRQKEELEREKQAFSKEKADLAAIKKDRERLAGENARLNESMKALQDRISALEVKLNEYEERIRSYEVTIDQNKETMAGLETKIKQKDDEISKLNETISGYMSTIAELTETLNVKDMVLAEKDAVIKEKDDTINAYMRKTSELDRYLLEFREIRLSERGAMRVSRATLILGAILGIVGAVFAIFAEPLVLSAGIANALRVKVAVTLLGLALPLCMISVTYRLFATRQSVLYLNVTGLVVAASTVVLFDLYYPEGFLHPFAGTLYFLYALAVAMHFTAVLLSLPRVRSGGGVPTEGTGGSFGGGEEEKPGAVKEEGRRAGEGSEEVRPESESAEGSEEDLFEPIGQE